MFVVNKVIMINEYYFNGIKITKLEKEFKFCKAVNGSNRKISFYLIKLQNG